MSLLQLQASKKFRLMSGSSQSFSFHNIPSLNWCFRSTEIPRTHCFRSISKSEFRITYSSFVGLMEGSCSYQDCKCPSSNIGLYWKVSKNNRTCEGALSAWKINKMSYNCDARETARLAIFLNCTKLINRSTLFSISIIMGLSDVDFIILFSTVPGTRHVRCWMHYFYINTNI